MQNKQLQQEPKSQASILSDDAHWIRRVINNEQTKPLEVPKSCHSLWFILMIKLRRFQKIL